jgi:hypothetical protein
MHQYPLKLGVRQWMVEDLASRRGLGIRARLEQFMEAGQGYVCRPLADRVRGLLATNSCQMS